MSIPDSLPEGKPAAPLPLLPQHLADLRKSGLTDDNIRACRFRSVTQPADVAEILNWTKASFATNLGPCLCIPYYDASGKSLRYVRLKPDQPRSDKGGKPNKYESPKGQPNRSYFPPNTRSVLSDPSIPLLITEGEKKAAKADQEGFCCIGLVGVYGWQQKRPQDKDGKGVGPRELIPDLAAVAWKDRRVTIVFDSDASTKPEVQWAEWHLAMTLQAADAVVRVVRLPSALNGEKVGLDDFLVAQDSDALCKLIEVAKPPTRPNASAPQSQSLNEGVRVRSQVLIVPDYKPFPVEALPWCLREYVVEAAAAVGCDPAFVGLPALTVAGAAAGGAVVVSPKRRWREPPALWTCTVGDSGTGKSPGLNYPTALAFEIDRRLKIAHTEAMKRYNADLEAWNESDHHEEKPVKPIREYFAVSDTTVERLAEMLGGSPRGVLLFRDELSGWFGSFTRYKSKGGTDVPNWLSLFDAGPIRVHRRTGEPRDIEADRGLVAVCGGIQPDILRDALSDPAYVASGLAAKIIFASPPKACPRWTDRDLSEETEAKFTQILNKLRALPFAPKDGPDIVRLDPSARARFRRLNDEFAESAENLDGGPMSAVLPKAVRYALRLAFIHHLVTHADHHPERISIGDHSMQAGETLARWFVHEADRVYAMLAERPEDRTARRLMEWVRRKGGWARPRDLQRSNPARYPAAALAELALDSLVTAGFGTWIEEPYGPKGGAPTRRFVLDTQPDTRHNPTQPAADIDPPDESPPDTTSDLRPPTTGLPGDSEVVSGSVKCRVEPTDEKTDPTAGTPPPGVVSGVDPDIPQPRREYSSDDRPYDSRW